MNKWYYRFLRLAKEISTWSKDPSTKTGAVIVDSNKRIVSVGYNGFPRGVKDDKELYEDRELKYNMIVHCEINAILFAQRNLSGCALYTWPFCSCSRCASCVIQSGIELCVAPKLPSELEARWGENIKLSKKMFKEAGVELIELDYNGE